MKHLPQFFSRSQLKKLFICFPDPHFKARKHKARIVSAQLCAEYAYVVKPGQGMVYTITDVAEVAEWMVGCFEGKKKKRKVEREEARGKGEKDEKDEKAKADGERGGGARQEMVDPGVEELWERVSQEELDRDPCVAIMQDETEEGKKVTRNGGNKYVAVWRRKEDPAWPE